ncbi:PH domain-containing protein [Quadrisphaera sp. INWT6]|uniref:PH domain-containing protein n=1 Tax=Quadrisphaera sp. INWT6 TaxID=2596917 RepID=UPI001891F84B|nr:PH domain-containing protein [Quadrisphaera sp. INWT6]
MLAAVLVVLAVRVPRLRVETGADVVVVNLLRTHRLAWPDVERFAVGRGGVELRRAGGGRVPVHAFPGVAGLTRSAELRLDLAAEGLERARRRHADGARTDAPRTS